MEKFKKRLGVFRAITQDISPDIEALIKSEESKNLSVQVFSPSNSGSSFNSDHQESMDFSFTVPFKAEENHENFRIPESTAKNMLSSPTSKISKDLQKLNFFEQKNSSFLNQRKLEILGASERKMENRYFDSPLNKSSSFSYASQIMNSSTEESSKEKNEERRKPRKRPLEEGEKSFYVIKLDVISNHKDCRTTVMIKNIPNKYTQKMLLQAIDCKFAGTYNFLYLPIDFKVFPM